MKRPSRIEAMERERARAREWLTHNTEPAESPVDCFEKLREQGFSLSVAAEIAGERA